MCTNCNNQTQNKYCSIFCNNQHYRQLNKEHRRTLQKKWRLKNKKPILAKCTVCHKKYSSSRTSSKYCGKDCYGKFRRSERQTESFKARDNLLSKERYLRMRRDPERRLKVDLRCRLNRAIKSNYKVGSAVQTLGCSIKELKVYLESKFQPGMTWKNWSRDGWHVDHVRPLSSFNLSNVEQLKQACHYTNLQPLWAKDNMRKGSKYELCSS